MFKENKEPQITTEAVEDKEAIWDKKLAEINEIADNLGHGIDDAVKEVIIGLQLLGVDTRQSCEGHVDSGISAPWIQISEPEKPEEQFIDELEKFREVAEKYNLSVDRVIHGEPFEAWSEAVLATSDEETQEYKEWRQKNEPLKKQVEGYLEEFYQDRDVTEDEKLVISENATGEFEIGNGGEDYRPAEEKWKNMDDKGKQALKERLVDYQEEVRSFGEFLREKFLD